METSGHISAAAGFIGGSDGALSSLPCLALQESSWPGSLRMDPLAQWCLWWVVNTCYHGSERGFHLILLGTKVRRRLISTSPNKDWSPDFNSPYAYCEQRRSRTTRHPQNQCEDLKSRDCAEEKYVSPRGFRPLQSLVLSVPRRTPQGNTHLPGTNGLSAFLWSLNRSLGLQQLWSWSPEYSAI